ncbi:hypothetical protein KVR01_004713 [Diaporthe batatas]|uniref:uncharacterized protein n=1 Tax=Diaporthe batatas TaxID=748121 RepID=UPI001D03D882|nr:uncharacterized protein KVR01_004713 [Diaporthe batatas]KAG8166161.1 hypothetical protein KVR01_004713 [Diaporthe batatas]
MPLTAVIAGVTYLAGCTDPTFLDEQCAQKPGYTGQQWVALARCSGENISLWTGCAHHPSQVELEKENCSCNLTNVLIENTNGQSSLGEIGSLPTSAGGTISFNPTALPTYAVTTTEGSSSVASGTATATAAEGASGGASDGLSGGAKAGIAVGSIIGGLLPEGDDHIAGLGYKSEMPGESTYKPELPGDMGAADAGRRHELGT